MNDPYKVLGVEYTASDDEIKQAYRELAKKYHPDNYVGSPLSDLAGERMAEINAAYDAVQAERRGGQQSSGGGYSAGQQGARQGYRPTGGAFDDIRRLISMNRILEAGELLDGIPTASRTAEWHFLKGSVLYSRGFLEDALQYLQTAVQMEPQNYEYRSTLDAILRQRQYGYGQSGPVVMGGGCSPCALCSACFCADCMCSACRCCSCN